MGRDQSSIVRGFLSILFGKAGIILVSLIFTPLVVRILGAEAYGDYAYVISLMSVFTLVSNFGFNDGVRKYIAEEPSAGQRAYEIYIFYLKSSFLIALVFTASLFSLVYFDVSPLIPQEYHRYIYILCLIVLSNQIFQVSRYGLMGLGREERSESLNVIFKLVSAAIGVALAAYGLGVTGLLVGHLLTVLPIGVVSFYMIRKLARVDSSRLTINRDRLVKYGASSFALVFLTSSLYHVDILLLGSYNMGENLGYYKAALVVAELLWFVPQSVQTVLLHSTSAIWKEGDMDRITSMSSTATRFTLIFTLLCTVGLFILSEEFVSLYFGESFAPTVQPLKILLPGVLLFALSRPIFAVGQGRGDMKLLILATLSAAGLNLALNLVLIPRFGTTGAAVATSISYGSMVLFHTVAALQMGYNPFSDIRALRTAICGIITYVVLERVNLLIVGDLFSILIVAMSGFVIYVGLILVLGSVSRAEVRQVLSTIIT